MVGLTLRSKWIYLSFLQNYFKTHERYSWSEDVRSTNIIIADKYAIDLGVAAKRPTIVLDRGPMSWAGYFRNEAMPLNTPGVPRIGNIDRSEGYSLTDLMQGSITLNVIHKTPFVADEIANEVFYYLSSVREELKKFGIYKVTGFGIGKENVVTIGADKIHVTLVPINISFITQESVQKKQKQFKVKVYSEAQDLVYKEGIDYYISPDGLGVHMIKETDANIFVDYVDAITLENISSVNLIKSIEEDTLYTIENSGKIYGYYKIFEKFLGTIDNEEWIK